MNIEGAPGTSPPGTIAPGVSHRLHPLTPVVIGARVVPLLFISLPGLLSGSEGPGATTSHANGSSPVATLVPLGLIGFGMIASLVRWLVTRWGFDAGELRVDSGLIARQSKRVRLDRIQSVDVLQPLFARIFGLAELRVTTAGSEKAALRLCYLSLPQATALRAELLGRASGLGPRTPSAPERPLVVVPVPTLVASSLVNIFSARSLAAVAVSAAIAIPTFTSTRIAHGSSNTTITTVVIIIFVLVTSSAATAWKRISTLWAFTLADSPDGLRIRHGLLSTQSHTIPPGRIQAIEIHQPLLWRPFGWARVQMNVAGYVGERQAGFTVLLPVGPRSFAQWLIDGVLGGVDVGSVTMRRPPRRAALCAPLWWRGQAVGGDDRILVARRGIISRTVVVVPHERTQSVRLRCGPWQRLWGLASVHLDSTRGPVRIRISNRDVSEARSILDRQAQRARAARRLAPGTHPMAPRAL